MSTKKEIVSFRKDIAPNTNDWLQERIKANGVVTEIRVRFYPGVERSLKVRPYVEHKGKKPEDMFTYPATTEPFITGDDDYYTFPVWVEVAYDDFVKIYVQNTELTYTYTLVVDVVVQYFEDDENRRGL